MRKIRVSSTQNPPWSGVQDTFFFFLVILTCHFNGKIYKLVIMIDEWKVKVGEKNIKIKGAGLFS
jgi:hypothetical protein